MKFQRFKNRTQAGALLARQLTAYARRADVIVLALPRGGVPVGFAIVQKLDVPLDVLLVRKLGTPGQKELAMGAVASGGLCVLRPDIIDALGIQPDTVETMVQIELDEIARRELRYRAGRPPLHVEDRVVILVDDGLATGATMLAAVHVLRQARPTRIVVAVPVAPRETSTRLRAEVDQLICLATPEPFYAVGFWYENFEQVSDDTVSRLLQRAARAGAGIGPEQDAAQAPPPSDRMAPKPDAGSASR